VPKDDLCTILQPSDLRLRTGLEQRRAVERAKGTAAAAAAEAGGVRTQDLGVHPVRSGLWGFALSEAGGNWSSSHAAFGYDTMHIEDLGVFLYLVYSISEYLKRKYPSTHVQLLAELEARMKCMPRANDCRLAAHAGPHGGYCWEKGRIQAKEHRATMQVGFTAACTWYQAATWY
jgi:hypothetical protein